METSVNKFEPSQVTSGQRPSYWTRAVFGFSHSPSSVISSTLVATVGFSSFLTMSENFQNPSFLGTPHFLQLSLPVVSNAAPLTGSDCNFSSIPALPVSSAWLLPSASGTSFQPVVGSAYLYQHSSTTMLSGVSGQSHISISAASYPGVFQWDITGSTEKKSSSLGDVTVTVTDQDTAVSSMPMSTQYDTTSDNNTRGPPHPSLSDSLLQGTASQNPNPGNSLSLPYQEGSQIYYYNQGTLGPLLTGDHDPCLQPYGSVSHTGGRASAFQQETVMVLREVQPTNGLPPVSNSGIYYSVSAQPITEANFQVMETSLRMETSLGLQLPSQTFCLSQTTEFSESCSSRNLQIFESNPPSELGDTSMRAPINNSGNLLALPPAPSQEQTELDEIKTKLSKPLEAYQVTTENQHSPPLLPIQIPDIHQLLACIDPLSQEEQSCSGKPNLGKNSMGLEDQGTFESGMESSSGLADTAALVEDIHLPQLFNSLKDFDQSKGPKATKAIDTKTIKANQVQNTSSVLSSVIKRPSEQTRKNKHKASDPISGAPKATIQAKNSESLLEEEVFLCNDEASDKDPTAKTSNSKPQETASSRNSNTKGHGQEKTKRSRENNSKNAEESKQTGNKVKREEKPTIPNRKRKKNQPEFIQENFKKPRSGLGMHLLASVQVVHALGKKSDKKTGRPSSHTLGDSNNTKDHRLPPAIKPGLDTPREGKGPEKTQVKAQKAEGSAPSSPSQYELPPPGKVKLIPLPFLIDKPPTRPAPRRRQSLASRRPSVAHPAQPGSTSSAQPTAVCPPRPTPAGASWAGSARPAQPISTNPTQPGLNNPTLPSVPESAASRPAPYKTSSCTSFQWDPVPTAGAKLQFPLKPHNQFLLQDFASQPKPWRKPNVPEPVMSKPITKEQRTEHEAMKRKVQQERENAAKYTSWGKVQFFIQREKDMEISEYYGYPI